MFTIVYVESVDDDLSQIRVFERRQILDRIEEQLLYEPAVETRNKKPLVGVEPTWEHEKPVWELRVGEVRVFYDVKVAAEQVTIRVIRHKPPHKTTQAIL